MFNMRVRAAGPAGPAARVPPPPPTTPPNSTPTPAPPRLPQFTAKQLERESKRNEKKQREEEKKAADEMRKGRRDLAKIHVSNAIREKSQALNMLRLASRMDAVAGNVERAVRMNNITKSLVSVTDGMEGVLEGMDVDKIASVMEKFEKQFDSLDVRAGYMDSAIASTTATAVPEDEVDTMMDEIATRNGLEIGDSLPTAGRGSTVAAATAAAAAPSRVAMADAPLPPTGGGGPGGKPPGGDGGGEGGAPVAGGAGGGAGGGGGDLAARLAALRGGR